MPFSLSDTLTKQTHAFEISSFTTIHTERKTEKTVIPNKPNFETIISLWVIGMKTKKKLDPINEWNKKNENQKLYELNESIMEKVNQDNKKNKGIEAKRPMDFSGFFLHKIQNEIG